MHRCRLEDEMDENVYSDQTKETLAQSRRQLVKCVVIKSIVIALFSTMLFGFAEGITFGIKAGINIANFHGDHPVGNISRIGFCGAGFVTVELTDIFVVQPEVLYTQKGEKWELIIGPQEYLIGTFKYDYIEFPLLFRLVSQLNGGIEPNFLAGPYFAINVNAKEKIEENGISTESNYDEFVKDTDFGIVLGGGVDFPLKKGKIVLDGRYVVGLTTTSEEQWDMKNNVISFMLGYSF